MPQLPTALPGQLLQWYDENRRILPWREEPSPYRTWISEVMLQQTRVEAGIAYFERFTAALPDIPALAAVEEQQLLKLWEGLGYYSRARNLKKAAIQLMQEHNGQLPADFAALCRLPGLGEHSAGAIASIAFDIRVPAVDGNVLRVCARLTDDGASIDLPDTKKKVRMALEAIYPACAGDFTQALMELGATLCGPNWKPQCGQCPCAALCRAFQNGTAESLPVRSPKKEKRQEDRTVFILSCDGRYALHRREKKGLLAGLWEFPNVSGRLQLDEAMQAVEKLGIVPREVQRQVERKHIFTHIQWNLRGYYLEAADCTGDFSWFTREEIEETAALPTAFRQFWEEIDYV